MDQALEIVCSGLLGLVPLRRTGKLIVRVLEKWQPDTTVPLGRDCRAGKAQLQGGSRKKQTGRGNRKRQVPSSPSSLSLPIAPATGRVQQSVHKTGMRFEEPQSPAPQRGPARVGWSWDNSSTASTRGIHNTRLENRG